METAPPPLERREYHRYDIWFPVILATGGAEVWGTCRDASSKGLLVSTKTALAVGDNVTVTFRVTREGTEHCLPARIVRQGQSEHELRLTFPYAVAVEFDHPQSALENRIRYASEPAGRATETT